jgi:hypothetical protein
MVIQKVTSNELLTKQEMRRSLLYTKNYWGPLVPRINIENACIQQISFMCFSIYTLSFGPTFPDPENICHQPSGRHITFI